MSYHYGFNGDMGGGEYARASTFTVENQAAVLSIFLTQPARRATPRCKTQSILRSRSFRRTARRQSRSTRATPIRRRVRWLSPSICQAGTTLELRAADGARPTLLLSGEISVSGEASSSFYMNGLLIAADPGMAPGTPLPAALVHVPAQRPDDSANHSRHTQHSALHPCPRLVSGFGGCAAVWLRCQPDCRAFRSRGRRLEVHSRRCENQPAGDRAGGRQHHRRHRSHPCCVCRTRFNS